MSRVTKKTTPKKSTTWSSVLWICWWWKSRRNSWSHRIKKKVRKMIIWGHRVVWCCSRLWSRLRRCIRRRLLRNNSGRYWDINLIIRRKNRRRSISSLAFRTSYASFRLQVHSRINRSHLSSASHGTTIWISRRRLPILPFLSIKTKLTIK